jgi:hypothetical protein
MQRHGPADRRLPDGAMAGKLLMRKTWRQWLLAAALAAAAAAHGGERPPQPRDAPALPAALQSLLALAARSDEQARLQLINRYFNPLLSG